MTTASQTLPGSLSFPEACEQFSKNYKGRRFFRELTNFIAGWTGVSYVLVGYPEAEDLTSIKTAVLYADGKFIDNFSYPLTGTPCENVIGRNCCYYPSGIQQMFPNDKELHELGIESYLGSPIFDDEKAPLGLLVLMDSKLIQNPREIETGLQLLVPRVSRELRSYIKRRKRAETSQYAS